MRRIPALLLAAAVLVPSAAAARPAGEADCSSILPGASASAETRPLAPEDLARLRDIGPVDPEPFAEPFFTISPDGRRAAFQLRRADPAANDYCLAMVIVALDGRDPPRIVDKGGDLILLTIDARGIADVATGITSLITPRWSPDGKWIAFLKRSAGSTQVWRAMADGSGSTQLTHSDHDVVDFRLGAAGSTIIYAVRPGIDTARQVIAAEALRGWHYDDRFSPFARKEPFPLEPIERQVQVLELETGRVRGATVAEAALVGSDRELIATAGSPAPVEDKDLSISATKLMGGAAPGALHARLADGRLATCSEPACEGALNPWWMPGKSKVRFFRREGWARASTAIHEWDPATGRVHRLYLTDDVLASCAPDGASLICLRDSSLKPRRLERLDPASGRSRTLFDPNPQFASLTLGDVERLHWRNAYGIETIADLVLPTGYERGRHYPMIVVQYDTRGFLRGGTGDEYPIQAFANRGYAVLSFRRPGPIAQSDKAKDFEQAGKLDLAGFADRRSVQSSLEAGVRLAIERGVADPKRVGITGLSDGATTVMWELVHSHLFAAAAMSTCCIDTTLAVHVGPSAMRHFAAEGYPGMLGRDDPFWNDVSLSVNARKIHTPLLLQLADDEFLSSLESYTALREAKEPVDLFEFPDEHHVKWQPAHRLAIYRRVLDWFDYWLRGIRSDSPDRQGELKHWDELKSEAASEPAR